MVALLQISYHNSLKYIFVFQYGNGQAVQLTSLITRRKWTRTFPVPANTSWFGLARVEAETDSVNRSDFRSCELETLLTAGSFLKWCIKETLCCRFKGMEIFHSKIAVWDIVSYRTDIVSYRTLNGMRIIEKKSFQNALKEEVKYNTKRLHFKVDCLNTLFICNSYISFAINLEGMSLFSKKRKRKKKTS